MKKQKASNNYWNNRIVEHGEQPANQFLAHELNARRHPGKQREALLGSLNEVGWVAPVIVSSRTGKLLDGHARIEEALTKDENTLVPFVKVDVSEGEERLILASFDPITNQATYDREALDALLREVSTGEAGLQELLADLAKANDLYVSSEPSAIIESGDDFDDTPDEKQTRVQLGDIWKCGEHLIACGDSTDHKLWSNLLGNERAQICWTDPPWNVNYERTIVNDNLGKEFVVFAAQFATQISEWCLPGAPLYVAMSAQEWPVIDKVLRDAGFHWSSTVIWVKDSLVLSRKDYHTQYEPIWYGWKEGAARIVELKDRTQSDTWFIPRPKRSDEHPTMKPIALVARALINSSNLNSIVIDPFGGSGTTMIAAERANRRARLIELEPKYVNVILTRWESETGKQAALLKRVA